MSGSIRDNLFYTAKSVINNNITDVILLFIIKYEIFVLKPYFRSKTFAENN